MNSETFSQFLKTPAYLYRISYQELKSLVVQYPYCQNLRYLLLKKSQADQHAEYDRNLQMAATYSVNRGFLYEQLYDNENTPANRESNVALEEESLILKDLEKLYLKPQKEILLAEVQEELELNIASSEPSIPSLELPKTDVLEVVKGEISSDDLPNDLDVSIEELFSEPSEDELISSGLILPEEEHLISEIFETEEESLSNIVSNEAIENLDITEVINEEDIPDLLPKTISDDIEDLFAEETEIALTPVFENSFLENNTSLGLDAEPVSDTEDILQNKKKVVDDFPIDIASGAEEVSNAPIVANSHKNEEDSLEEVPSSSIDLEIKTKETKSSTIDIADLSPVSQSDSVDEEDEFETETEVISPQSSFSNWLKQFNSPQISVEIENLDEKDEKKKVNYTYELVKGEWKQIKKKVKKKKKKSKAELIAAESVKLSKNVSTETLAQLLEKQEHYSKAIKMYERLRLENPEKSDYFASKIETLQLKL